MADNSERLDFIVVGATPLAVVVAQLLARAHGKKVALVGAAEHPLRVSRGFDLSVAPLTRPAHWDLLTSTRGETLKIMGELGRAIVQPTDIAFTGHGRRAEVTLGHIRHLAAGFGELTEPLTREAVIRHGNGFILRGAMRLRRRAFFATARNWLAQAGVGWFTQGSCALSVSSTGTILSTGDQKFRADSTLFCDGRMAADLVAPENLPVEVTSIAYCGLMTEPGTKLHWPSLVDVGANALAFLHDKGRAEAWVAGDKETAIAWLEGVMEHNNRTRLAGLAELAILGTPDGAPLIARMPRIRAQLALDLGASGLFVAPALARYFAGEASRAEQEFFDTHASGKPRETVGEFVSGRGGAL